MSKLTLEHFPFQCRKFISFALVPRYTIGLKDSRDFSFSQN